MGRSQTFTPSGRWAATRSGSRDWPSSRVRVKRRVWAKACRSSRSPQSTQWRSPGHSVNQTTCTESGPGNCKNGSVKSSIASPSDNWADHWESGCRAADPKTGGIFSANIPPIASNTNSSPQTPPPRTIFGSCRIRCHRPSPRARSLNHRPLGRPIALGKQI